jgi:hypothetical protein
MDSGVLFWVFIGFCVLALIYKARRKETPSQTSSSSQKGGGASQTSGRPQKPTKVVPPESEIPISAAESAIIEERTKIENQFENMFALVSKSQRENIVQFNMEKYRCDRFDAMKHAIQDRMDDEKRLR